VVCGHADRHVVRVELHSGSGRRTAFLKREHVFGRRARLRNRLAGYGWVSRCEREAVTLAKLESAGLPGPQWLAYGQDSEGRGFLLVDELAGAIELREYLTEYTLSAEDRRLVCERIGRAIAELHGAGFGTPELAAKHLFVQPGVMAVSLLDWQSTPPPRPVAPPDRVRWFATLHATLATDLASPRDRLRVLWAYRRTLNMIRAKSGSGKMPERFGRLARAVERSAMPLANKSSVRLQRQAVSADVQQRLVWLAGEAVVAIPEVAAVWPTQTICAPFFPDTPEVTPTGGHRERVTFADGRQGVMVRFTTSDPLGRLLAAVRERPWRSPGATAARVLFHLQRHDIPAPRLLAFGQRMTSRTGGESFVVGEMPPHATAVSAYLADPTISVSERRVVLRECGRLLRKLHDAGCRPARTADPNDPLFVVSGLEATVAVGSPFAVRVARRVNESERRRDVKRFVASLARSDRARVLRGYSSSDRAARKAFAATVLRPAWA
jgi:tRNA A-37 threonylcarbamoyl transferase component Bud32